MAFSLFSALTIAGVAAAQNDGRPYSPQPSIYNARIAPWPSAKPAPPLPLSPATVPPLATPDSARTLYYKKEAGSGVIPTGAAMPAQEPSRKADPLPKGGASTDPSTTVDVELPGPDKLFRLEGEARMRSRTNEDRTEDNKKVKPDSRKAMLELPKEDPVSNQPPISGPNGGRSYAQMMVTVEPNFVCYGRPYFEEKNAERYGWDLGPIQPVISMGKFVSDVSSFPYKFFSYPCLRYDCSAGYCLPGDPVPYFMYPQGASLTGTLGQVGASLAVYALIP